MIYTFFYTNNAKNISLAWDQAPGKKEKQQLLGSLRSPLFFLFYPVFCLFPQYGAWSQAQTITLSASEFLDAIKLMMLNLLSVATNIY